MITEKATGICFGCREDKPLVKRLDFYTDENRTVKADVCANCALEYQEIIDDIKATVAKSSLPR